MNKIHHSGKLNLDYKIKFNKDNNRVIIFEDGINYSNFEMKQIKNKNSNDLKNIHLIKKIFEGVVI